MTTATKIMRGIQIITKYDPKASSAAEHDVFYCGDYSKSAPKMTPEELAEMKKLGWLHDESTDSWQRFT